MGECLYPNVCGNEKDQEIADLRAKLEQAHKEKDRLYTEIGLTNVRLGERLKEAEAKLEQAVKQSSLAYLPMCPTHQQTAVWDDQCLVCRAEARVRRLEEALREASSAYKVQCAGGEQCRLHDKWDLLLGDAVA